MTTNLTDQEIEELRIAIAEEMGWTKLAPYHGNGDIWGIDTKGRLDRVSPYTTSIDAIQVACLERFKSGEDAFAFHGEIIRLECDGDKYCWQLTALDWAIAFARTAKIWRYKV